MNEQRAVLSANSAWNQCEYAELMEWVAETDENEDACNYEGDIFVPTRECHCNGTCFDCLGMSWADFM